MKDGISGNSIDLFARIVCIADVYHAMTSDRSYRKALTKEKAIDEFIKGKGTQFDSMLVDYFIEIIESSTDTIISRGETLPSVAEEIADLSEGLSTSTM